MWQLEWENLRQDFGLFPKNDAEKALLRIIEYRINKRWLRRWKNNGRIDESGTAVIKVEEKVPPTLVERPRWNEQFFYRMKLECVLGSVFALTFLILTFVLLFPLSLIFNIQYQPLVYLLLIPAVMIIYTMPIPFDRSWKHGLECYAVPLIAVIYCFVNSTVMPFSTVLCLWFFTSLYYVLLHVVVWAGMALVNSLDHFEFAYLMALRYVKL